MWVEGTDKIEVSSGFVSSGTLSSAEEDPRGLPLENKPIIVDEDQSLVAVAARESDMRCWRALSRLHCPDVLSISDRGPLQSLPRPQQCRHRRRRCG